MNGGCMQKVGKKLKIGGQQIDSDIWEHKVVEPLFEKLSKNRSKYVANTLSKNLSLIDGLVFRLARRYEWNKLIGFYFKNKVSVLVTPYSFGVRIYQKEYCSEMLGEKNFINSQFKLN